MSEKMNEKEIFNHLLAMSLKISADRRLKKKKYNKVEFKEKTTEIQVDKILSTVTIFKCKMCNGHFNAKTDYYTHNCPNWKSFHETPKNLEIESQVPVFKIPKTPLMKPKMEEKVEEKVLLKKTPEKQKIQPMKAKTTHKYRLILPKLTREPKTTSLTNIGLELNPDYVQIHPKTPRNYFLKVKSNPQLSPPPLRPLPRSEIFKSTSNALPSTLRLFELLTAGTKNEVKTVEPKPKLKFSIESILGSEK
jgi:hypothetical protein